MFPTINKKETGVNLRRIMDMRGVKPKDIVIVMFGRCFLFFRRLFRICCKH